MAQELIHDGKLDRQAAADALREFLENTIRGAGLQLKVTVTVAAPGGGSDAEVLADVDGRDKEILLERGADVLKALEHLAFRALRFEELRMTAKVAAERVQASKQAFPLNPMTSRERRIVHLALKDMPGIRTESVGVGEHRQVVIHPADKLPSK